MAHTPLPRPGDKFITIGGHIINRDEVLWVQPQTTTTGGKSEVIGVRVEFIRRGYVTINGITPEGVLSLLNGNPF